VTAGHHPPAERSIRHEATSIEPPPPPGEGWGGGGGVGRVIWRCAGRAALPRRPPPVPLPEGGGLRGRPFAADRLFCPPPRPSRWEGGRRDLRYAVNRLF